MFATQLSDSRRVELLAQRTSDSADGRVEGPDGEFISIKKESDGRFSVVCATRTDSFAAIIYYTDSGKQDGGVAYDHHLKGNGAIDNPNYLQDLSAAHAAWGRFIDTLLQRL